MVYPGVVDAVERRMLRLAVAVLVAIVALMCFVAHVASDLRAENAKLRDACGVRGEP